MLAEQHYPERGHAGKWDFLHFSDTRGNLPVLTPEAFDEDQSVHVIANGGAQLMNSPIYMKRKEDTTALEVIQTNERATAGVMVGYTRPQDTLVYATRAPGMSNQVLSFISESYEDLSIPVTRNFIPVSSIDNYHPGKVPLLPNVISPEVLAVFNKQELGYPLTHYYRKDEHQQLWERNGLPTPRTSYLGNEGFDGRVPSQRGVAIEPSGRIIDETHAALARLGGFHEYVVNVLDGSGGYGIVFAKYPDAVQEIDKLLSDPYNDRIQIQGRVPWVHSPCLVGRISDQEVQVLFASDQRFSAPGVYAGNRWDSGFIPRVIKKYPNFIEIHTQAMEVLQKEGVRGQVNIDSMLLDQYFAQSMGISDVLLREVNIRPAGSSVVNRLQNGKINGKTVDKVFLSAGLPIDYDTLQNMDGVRGLNNSFATTGIQITLYNYNIEKSAAALAFVGTAEVSAEQLEQTEQLVRSFLNRKNP